MEKGSIGNLQIIAGQRGGKCLSEVYQGIWQKLAFQCAEGHIWNASPANIKKGTWCPVCAHLRHQGRPLRYSIETLEALANQHGGKCLSTEYKGMGQKHTFQCTKGHVWDAAPANIKKGTWCPVCAHQGTPRRHSIETLEALAQQHGGKCLSTEYKGMGQKHKFQCAEGHVWDTVPSSIQRGTWCPVCGHLKISQQNRGRFRCSIETLEALANQRGGVCLSTEYRGPQEKLTFRCAKEHTWDAIPNSIQQGRWCPICKRRGPRDMEGDPLDKVKEIAANLDVECLSAEYKGMGQKLTFRCRKGHTWEASPVAIKQGKKCPVCRDEDRLNNKDSLDKLNALANHHGGICLSEVYKGMRQKHTFQCVEGHTWEARPFSIQQGTWCPVCVQPGGPRGHRGPHRMTEQKNTHKLTMLEALAKQHGGKCLSTEYRGMGQKHTFLCAEGHTWEARPTDVKRGRWCPVCARLDHARQECLKKSDQLNKLKIIAESRGGKCLSEEYKGSSQKHSFQCAEGHVWDASPGSIKHGSWCSACFHRDRSIVKRHRKKSAMCNTGLKSS